MQQKTPALTDDGKNSIDQVGFDALPPSAMQDPFARFVVKHWRTILWAVVIVAAIIYGYNRYQTTQRESLSAAADLLATVQNQYQEYDQAVTNNDGSESGNNKVTEELEKLKQLLQPLAEKKEPYGSIAKLYKSAVTTGDTIPIFEGSQNSKLFSEFAALQAARQKLDTDFNVGFNELKRLATEGQLLAGAAALALAKIAPPTAKDEVKNILSSLLARQPEQREILAAVLPQYGL